MKSYSTSSNAVAIERRRFLSLSAGLALLAFAPVGKAQERGLSPFPQPALAPALVLPDADGKAVDLVAYRGKVVLVNFWATWCPPCRKEFPSLGRVRGLFPREDFEVLAVNVGEDPDTVFPFAGNTDFPVLFDREAKAMAAWPVRGLPTTLLIDRQGRITHRAVGGREFDDPEIVAAIRELGRS